MDDIVAQFMAVTSCEAPTAQQYLEASEWQLEPAVELYFASGGADAAGNPPAQPTEPDSGVRETIAGFNDQLIDEEAQMMNDLMRNSRRAEARSRPRGIFNQSRDTDYNDPQMTKHERRLANLFRPPFDLISDVPLDEARELAQHHNKLVMVNVQDSGEFVCQRLNRDLWRNQQLKDVVHKNFVFLQYDVEDPDGEDYRSLYPFEQFPHIAIIDPWTGEQQKVWAKVPEEAAFIEDVVEFVATHLDAADEDEEEEPAATPAAPASQPLPTETAREPAPANTTAAIEPLDIPEPPPGPETTRIQLRYGDGKRIVRRFLVEDPVSTVYAVAKHVLQFSGAVTLTSERRDLKTELAKTVGEANLKNSTILVEQD